LLVEFDLFLIFSDPIALSPGFVRDALHVGFHDANVVGEEVDALSQFRYGHVPRVLVFGRGSFGLRLLCGLIAVLGHFRVFRRGAAIALFAFAPNIVSFQIVGAHGCF